MAKFLAYFQKNGKGVAMGAALLLWAVGVIQNCIIAVVAGFAATLNALNIDAFKNVSFAGIEFIGYVNAFVPVSEFVGLLAIYLVAWGLVIVFRWVKSLVPTMAN